MSRPPKPASLDDERLIWNLRQAGKGLRFIAYEVSISRGAFALGITQKERRARSVSHQWVSDIVKRQETEASKNPDGLPNLLSRQENIPELEVPLTKPQTNDKGGKLA